jgi:hypothetical protein
MAIRIATGTANFPGSSRTIETPTIAAADRRSAPRDTAMRNTAHTI